MALIPVYGLSAEPLAKGSILFGRSDLFSFAVAANPTKFFWDNTKYYLGIGTSTPTANLNVEGSVIFNDEGGDFNVRMEGDTDPNLFVLDGGNNAITIGGTTELAKFGIEGNADEVQFAVRGNATQTNNLAEWQNSSGQVMAAVRQTGQFSVYNAGTVTGHLVAPTSEHVTLARNAYDDSGWQRDLTSKYVVLAQFWSTTSESEFQVYSAAPAANPITNWKKLLAVHSSGVVVINEDAQSTADVRIESDTDVNNFFSDASTNRIGVGTATPAQKLDVNGITILRDALYFTQTDGNEKIDSANDGYMDYYATTAHRFNATIQSSGGRIANTTRQTTTYTALATDHIIYCDTDGGAWTLSLPAGVEGTHYKIINCGNNNLTIDPDGTEQLYGGGAGVALIITKGENIDIHYNATEGWY